MSAAHGRPQRRQARHGAATRRTGVTPSRGEGAAGECPMSAAHGRPQRRQARHGAATRRTGVTPSRGEGAGGSAS